MKVVCWITPPHTHTHGGRRCKSTHFNVNKGHQSGYFSENCLSTVCIITIFPLPIQLVINIKASTCKWTVHFKKQKRKKKHWSLSKQWKQYNILITNRQTNVYHLVLSYTFSALIYTNFIFLFAKCTPISY